MDSLTTAAAENPLGYFMGSPLIHDPRLGSYISTLGTISFPSKPPITYLK
ncbi:hypothetical protein HanXRQr2_Chr01g0009231 [Helianthus annuus]|uniref:Uncharacterized protein n=1 Tax=Helianthus annuus TaxID=4232 RepID=A0A9K3JTV7_HELAN|nr:hypothetical protein HanXRQr2_Chr01g0009231 [Helianthus annuus]